MEDLRIELKTEKTRNTTGAEASQKEISQLTARACADQETMQALQRANVQLKDELAQRAQAEFKTDAELCVSTFAPQYAHLPDHISLIMRWFQCLGLFCHTPTVLKVRILCKLMELCETMGCRPFVSAVKTCRSNWTRSARASTPRRQTRAANLRNRGTRPLSQHSSPFPPTRTVFC